MDLIFFGMQGAGKGTLGKSVAEKYGMEIFETGAELRKLSQEDNELARKVKSIIEAGHLVPNEVVMEIVAHFMENSAGQKPILFDGIPRKIEQAESLNFLLDKYGRDYKAVLIEIKRETALQRLTTRRIDPITKKVYPADYPSDISEDGNKLETRKDDNPEAIETRLKAFEEETIPAIKLYQERLITINGEQAIEEVKKEAYQKLDPLFT